jgi:hypothetical protein
LVGPSLRTLSSSIRFAVSLIISSFNFIQCLFPYVMINCDYYHICGIFYNLRFWYIGKMMACLSWIRAVFYFLFVAMLGSFVLYVCYLCRSYASKQTNLFFYSTLLLSSSWSCISQCYFCIMYRLMKLKCS